jgi:hypothetical protein
MPEPQYAAPSFTWHEPATPPYDNAKVAVIVDACTPQEAA